MTIGQLSREVGLPPATLRFYEAQGLFTSRRDLKNYRDYPPSTLAEVERIKRFRALGLSLPEIKDMLVFARDPQSHCAQVCQLMRQRLMQVREQQKTLQILEVELDRLLSICSGQNPEGCQILHDLGVVCSCATP